MVVVSNVAAALVRMQGPSKIDRTFCLSQTCHATVPVLHGPKGCMGCLKREPVLTNDEEEGEQNG